MAEEAGRARRLQSFEDSLKNERENKLSNLQRGIHDLRARLDLIEGDKSTYLGLTYRSFEAIDRKLTELTAAKDLVERAEKNVRRSTLLMAAVSVVALASLASHLFL
jgi:hypothetical protein